MIIYSDPDDDGYVGGRSLPARALAARSRGMQAQAALSSTRSFTGRSTSRWGAQRRALRLQKPRLRKIPTMPVNAQDAAVILGNLGGASAPPRLARPLPFAYYTLDREALKFT